MGLLFPPMRSACVRLDTAGWQKCPSCGSTKDAILEYVVAGHLHLLGVTESIRRHSEVSVLSPSGKGDTIDAKVMSEDQPLPTGLQLTSLDPVFREHPHEYLDRLRAQDPIHRDAELGRLFLTRFEDVREVVSNRSLSVDPRKAPAGSYYRRAVIGATPFEAFQPTMLHLDDPDHKRLRAIVTQAFTPFVTTLSLRRPTRLSALSYYLRSTCTPPITHVP